MAAALVGPWPTWWVEGPTEAALIDALTTCGPVPQADLFEPDERGVPWRARVVLDGLDDLEQRLAHGRVEPGEAPGRSEWRDRGRVGEHAIEVDGWRGTCSFDLEDGDLLIPDLVREGPAEPTLRASILAALGSRGEVDRVTAVRHRGTGRHGVLLEAAVPDRDPGAEREAVLQALSAAGDRLAPDGAWWFDAGRVSALAWLLVPPGPGAPGDAPLDGSIHGGPGTVELHVALPADRHDALAEELGEALGPLGWQGARPRWGRVGGAPRFLACWEGEDVDGRLALDRAAPWPARVVPGCPAGLEDAWLGVDPAWTPVGRRVLVRYRCGLRDRDLLPAAAPRDADDVDRAIGASLRGLGACDPVDAGGPALRLVLPGLDARAWEVVCQALGHLPEPAIGSVIPVGMGERTVVHLRRADAEPADTPPRWVSVR